MTFPRGAAADPTHTKGRGVCLPNPRGGFGSYLSQMHFYVYEGGKKVPPQGQLIVEWEA